MWLIAVALAGEPEAADPGRVARDWGTGLMIGGGAAVALGATVLVATTLTPCEVTICDEVAGYAVGVPLMVGGLGHLLAGGVTWAVGDARRPSVAVAPIVTVPRAGRATTVGAAVAVRF